MHAAIFLGSVWLCWEILALFDWAADAVTGDPHTLCKGVLVRALRRILPHVRLWMLPMIVCGGGFLFCIVMAAIYNNHGYCPRQWGYPALIFLSLLPLIAIGVAKSAMTTARTRCGCTRCRWAARTTVFWTGKVKIPKPQDLPVGRLNFRADYFMPYSVCPKCDNEGLHWMRPAMTADSLDSDALYHKAKKVMTGEMARHKPLRGTYTNIAAYENELQAWQDACMVKAAFYLLDGESEFDVMRTCTADDCKHTWGQNVGQFTDVLELEYVRGTSNGWR